MTNEGLVDEKFKKLPALEKLKFMAMEESVKNGSLLVIFDDQLMETSQHLEYLEAWSVSSHHLNMTLMFLSQQIFFDSALFRSLSLNSHYYILMKNPRDLRSVTTLASRMHPHHSEYVVEAYKAATAEGFGYLLIDYQVSLTSLKRSF